jgi:Holliday junction resolvase RusA-like endonuclease
MTAGGLTTLIFVVPGEPLPKGRPRAKAGQQPFTPKATRAAEARVLAAFREQHPGFVPLTGRLVLSAEFHRTTRRRVDTDNLLKLVTDALNRVAFVDDEQIQTITGTRVYGAGEAARTVVRIEVRDEGEQA